MTKKQKYKEIIKFIKRRFPKDCNWCDGNCYWFAVILHTRFPEFPIWLFQVQNHFVIGDGQVFFDWTGMITDLDPKEVPIEWEGLRNIDELYYDRIVRDCIN